MFCYSLTEKHPVNNDNNSALLMTYKLFFNSNVNKVTKNKVSN